MATMRPTDLEERVIAVVREVLAIDGDGPSLDSSIDDDLGADSLDQLSLFMALEDEFGGKIPEEEAQRLATLRDVVEYVRERVRAAGAE
jgi:acyl carrier protein